MKMAIVEMDYEGTQGYHVAWVFPEAEARERYEAEADTRRMLGMSEDHSTRLMTIDEMREIGAHVVNGGI